MKYCDAYSIKDLLDLIDQKQEIPPKLIKRARKAVDREIEILVQRAKQQKINFAKKEMEKWAF